MSSELLNPEEADILEPTSSPFLTSVENVTDPEDGPGPLSPILLDTAVKDVVKVINIAVSSTTDNPLNLTLGEEVGFCDNNISTSFAAIPWFWTVQSLQMFLAPAAILFNIFVLILVCRKSLLGTNVRIILGNLSLWCILGSAYLLGKAIWSSYAALFSPCSLEMAPVYCKLQELILVSMELIILGSIFALALDRARSSCKLSAKDKAPREGSCIGQCMLGLLWSIAVGMLVVSLFNIIQTMNTLPYCNHLFTYEPLTARVFCLTLLGVQLFNLLFYFVVLKTTRMKSQERHERGSYSLSWETERNRITQVTELLIPVIVLHAIIWTPIFIASAVQVETFTASNLGLQLMLSEYLFHTLALLYAAIHPLVILWCSEALRREAHECCGIAHWCFPIRHPPLSSQSDGSLWRKPDGEDGDVGIVGGAGEGGIGIGGGVGDGGGGGRRGVEVDVKVDLRPPPNTMGVGISVPDDENEAANVNMYGDENAPLTHSYDTDMEPYEPYDRMANDGQRDYTPDYGIQEDVHHPSHHHSSHSSPSPYGHGHHPPRDHHSSHSPAILRANEVNNQRYSGGADDSGGDVHNTHYTTTTDYTSAPTYSVHHQQQGGDVGVTHTTVTTQHNIEYSSINRRPSPYDKQRDYGTPPQPQIVILNTTSQDPIHHHRSASGGSSFQPTVEPHYGSSVNHTVDTEDYDGSLQPLPTPTTVQEDVSYRNPSPPPPPLGEPSPPPPPAPIVMETSYQSSSSTDNKNEAAAPSHPMSTNPRVSTGSNEQQQQTPAPEDENQGNIYDQAPTNDVLYDEVLEASAGGAGGGTSHPPHERSSSISVTQSQHSRSPSQTPSNHHHNHFANYSAVPDAGQHHLPPGGESSAEDPLLNTTASSSANWRDEIHERRSHFLDEPGSSSPLLPPPPPAVPPPYHHNDDTGPIPHIDDQ